MMILNLDIKKRNNRQRNALRDMQMYCRRYHEKMPIEVIGKRFALKYNSVVTTTLNLRKVIKKWQQENQVN